MYNLTVQITQRSGHQSGIMNVLGTYDLGVVDSQGQAVQGLHARTPITIVYHYQPKELVALGINSDRVVVTYPDLLAAANKAKASTKGLVIPMTNDAKNHTLTAQTTMLSATPFALGSIPTVQQPPKPHLASVSDNTGNLSYTYPLHLPPGPAGFTPPLAFNYSSAAPNQRHSPLAPADNVGDGWSLGLGSITADPYPDSSAGGSNTWYFLNGGDGSGDRLVPDSSTGFFQTEHMSHLRVQGTNMNSSGDTPGCFHVWDTSGTYFEYGCTPDSLQYWGDSNGQHTYRWDLNLMVAPQEGPNAPSKQIKVSYFQDRSNDATGYDSIRDAVVAQVVYQTVNPAATPTTTIAGTIDFSYRAPAVPGSVPAGTSSSWITHYGTNYNCQTAAGQPTTPPGTTTLRCDNPIDISSDVKAPAVMSVYSLQQITSYVGADSANHPAYKYTFNYTDTPFTQITDPITQNTEYAAGEHVLTSITPYQYLGGTAYALKQAAFSYTQASDTYYDGTQTASDGTTQFQVQTNWRYLTYYVDQNTNIGESITYQTAYSNTNGTPYVTDSNGVITDDRHDPFYCTTHANDTDTSKRCTGDYAHPDERSWSVQVVTVRSAVAKDSGATGLQPATYNYTYTLGAYGNNQQNFGGNGTFCSPAGNPVPAGEDDCVFDTYIPGNGSADQDWADYYHGEFRGFRKVYITPPDGSLMVRTYYTPAAWGLSETLATNYQSGQMTKEDIYWGTQEDDASLIKETVNHYSGTSDFLPQGSSADSTACNTNLDSTFTPCEPTLIFTKTTNYESNGTGTTNAPWVQTNYTYDDYDTSNGLNTSGNVYHNTTQEQTTSSNAPTVTKKWSYATNDSVDSNNNNYVYYTVNKVSHSETDDASGHVWQCQDTSYDEGVSGISRPAAGWATTVKTYSDCGNQSSTALTSYTGYDAFGNPVATVDPFLAAHSGSGCSLTTAPAVLSGSWTAGRYATCTVYDAYAAQATSEQNVLVQQSSVGYDDTQGRLPVTSTDVTGQTTTYSYSIDGNGNQTERVKKPGEPGAYTSQSATSSSCTFGSNRPCYEIDNTSLLYSGAVTRTFYGRAGARGGDADTAGWHARPGHLHHQQRMEPLAVHEPTVPRRQRHGLDRSQQRDRRRR